MLLNELFKSPSEWQWDETSNAFVQGSFVIGNYEYTVFLTHETIDSEYPNPQLHDYDFDYEGIDHVWSVEFRIGRRTDIQLDPNSGWTGHNDYGLTKTGNAAQVMATVIAMLQQFKSNQKSTTAFFFTAKEPSRRSFYDALTRRISPNTQTYNPRRGSNKGYLVV